MSADSLEQQALDRVARMYASYDRRPQPHPDAPVPHREPPVPPPVQKEHEAHLPPEKHPEKPTGLLDSLMEDKEQSLILLLLVILMKDGADLNLILALMYLII